MVTKDPAIITEAIPDPKELIRVLKIDIQSGPGHNWLILAEKEKDQLIELINQEVEERDVDEFDVCIIGDSMTREDFEALEEHDGW